MADLRRWILLATLALASAGRADEVGTTAREPVPASGTPDPAPRLAELFDSHHKIRRLTLHQAIKLAKDHDPALITASLIQELPEDGFASRLPSHIVSSDAEFLIHAVLGPQIDYLPALDRRLARARSAQVASVTAALAARSADAPRVVALLQVNRGVLERVDTRKLESDRITNFVLLGVEIVYWDLYRAYWTCHACDQAACEAARVWKVSKTGFEAGRVPLVALDRATQQVEHFRNMAHTARCDVVDYERQLRTWLGLPVADGARLVPSDRPTMSLQHPDLQAATQETLRLRPEMILAHLDQAAAMWNPDDGKENLAANQSVLDQERKAPGYLMLHRRDVVRTHEQIEIRRAKREAAAAEMDRRFKEYAAYSEEASLEDVLEAQRDWLEEWTDETTANVAYNLALAMFEFAKGTIQQSHRTGPSVMTMLPRSRSK